VPLPSTAISTFPHGILILDSKIYNGLALFAISLHPRFSYHRFAGPAIALGASVFSASVFAMVLGNQGWVTGSLP
jgi:uncharacterized membrane protein YgdD (TMEM256/DUF423 family)